MTRFSLALTAALFAFRAAPPGAQSNDLRIAVEGYDDWASAVAAIQHDVRSGGRSLTVHVIRGDGSNAPCGSYELGLDAVGAQAFQIETCNADTGTTTVRLVNRAALFGPGDVVPTPLHPSLGATYTVTAVSTGGADTSADSELQCRMSLRPYMDNLEDGSRVYLTPDRFDLRVLDAHVSVAPNSDGWSLSAPRGAALTVEYDITDRANGRTVAHRTATLTCEGESVPESPGESAPAPIRSFPSPEPRLPIVTLTADLTMSSLAYLPMNNVGFHVGSQMLSGNDLGIDGEPMLGTGLVGATLAAADVFVSVAPRTYVGEHVAVLDTDVAWGVSFRAGTTAIRVGPMFSFWTAALYGFPGGSGSTDLQVGFGGRAQLTSVRSWRRDDGRIGIAEDGVALTVPVLGEGCWSLAWTLSWGRGW